MIVCSDELADGAELQCDLCIVGAGPAGISLANEMHGSGLSIILLEAGGQRFVAKAQEGLLGEVEMGNAHSPPHMYRRRMLGGASSIWGGRCAPLDPIDLERRDYVPQSGWPIGWSDLERYYRRAQVYFDVGAFDYRVPTSLGPTATDIIEGLQHPDILTDRLERFSPPTDFGKKYFKTLARAPDIHLLLGAEALRLVAPEATLASTVAWLDVAMADKLLTVRATRYVLAAGGLETPRLLLASDQSRRGGLGNEGGALGRYYMCHLENTIGLLRLTPKDRPITLHFERSREGVYVRRKFALSAEAQLRERLLNMAFRFHYPLISNPLHFNGILSAVYLVKDAVLPEYQRKFASIELANRDRLHRDAAFWLAHGRNVLRDAPAVGWFCLDWTRRRILARRKLPFVVVGSRIGCYPFDVNVEQIPNPDSRVLLGGRTDRHNRPLLKVDWHMSDQDTENLMQTLRLLQRDFASSGVARLEFDDDTLPDLVAASMPVGGHHMGTARMAESPRNGVVDPNGTVHGISNLYCAGSAVFPTCGHANPTLTVVALAVRLADHLKAAFKNDRTRHLLHVVGCEAIQKTGLECAQYPSRRPETADRQPEQRVIRSNRPGQLP